MNRDVPQTTAATDVSGCSAEDCGNRRKGGVTVLEAVFGINGVWALRDGRLARGRGRTWTAAGGDA
eukprot:350863-Chlamydomonas_euryale.AAC.2